VLRDPIAKIAPMAQPTFSDDNLEVFRCESGGLRQVHTYSDAALILDGFKGSFDIMRFRLVYDGDLRPSANNNPRAEDKLALRNGFHPQIASLAATHPVMTGIGFATNVRMPFRGLPFRDESRDPPHFQPLPKPPQVTVGIADRQRAVHTAIFLPIERGNQHFIPLVRRSLNLACELDILFLRNDAPGSIVKSGGDLDNRIKTLFDGLRMPSADETKVGTPVADPCFCLLEDDSLISTFAVRTDRLLTDPERSPHRVLLVIEVKLTVLKLNSYNVGFLTD
jgi:hypothetical protein